MGAFLGLMLIWLCCVALGLGIYVLEYIEKYVPKDEENGLPVIISPRYRYQWQESKRKEE